MEQYHKKCPVHGCDFKQDYFCEECGYSWPGQNYMSTTGTPFGMFWLDGFRTPDGKVRQYVISAEKMRSVAAQVMEKRGEDSEDRVFAIGVAFYLSKDKKPDMPKREKPRMGQSVGGGGHMGSPMFFSPTHQPQNWNHSNTGSPPAFIGYTSSVSSSSCSSSSSISSKSKGGQHTNSVMRSKGIVTQDSSPRASFSMFEGDEIGCGLDSFDGAIDSFDGGVMICCNNNMEDIRSAESIETVKPVKKLEVGAGALVSQRVYDDPKNLKKYWEETPAGMIYINYCDEETLKKILDGGKKATKKDGFMDGVQVG